MDKRTIAIESTNGSDFCVAELRAVALPDNRLVIDITGEVSVFDENGEQFTEDRIKALVGSGLAWARRVVGLEAGLSIDVCQLTGRLQNGRELGVTYAVAVAIAESLNAKDADLRIEADNWRVRQAPELST